jgi:hypothetical protein
MAQLTKGHTFAGAETVTATKLNNLVDNATIANIVDADVSASAAIALSKLATGALPSGITVASANLVDGTIVDADINASAAISLSKLATGALPTAITVASANLVDGTIVNADVNASAAIAGTKVAPDFGSQNVVTTGTLGAGATTLAGNLTINDTFNVVLATGTGTKIGTAAGQKLGFYNATPVVQPAGANQAALTNSTGGTADGTLAAVSGTGDDADINNNFTELHTLLNEIRTALVNLGLIKGAA